MRLDVFSVNQRFVAWLESNCFSVCFYYSIFCSYNCCRDNYETWNVLSRARNKGSLFQKLKWPQDAEVVSSLLIWITHYPTCTFSSDNVCHSPTTHPPPNFSLPLCMCLWCELECEFIFPCVRLTSLDDVQKVQIRRLYSLLTIKDSAANIPKNLEARRRLEFFTNSLFMDMPTAKPVREMLSFR